jgi:phytoene synthase
MRSLIETAYKYCENVTKTHAKSFYFAAKFLPKAKQRPIYALYALCRHVDDAVDETEILNVGEAIRAVEKWKMQLDEVYLGAWEEKFQVPDFKFQNSQLVLSAWNDLLKTYKIPQNLPLELMQGVLMDTHIKRYETFDELYVYCYRVASTVGLMSSEIFGYADEKTLEYAEALGIAMQLTNILRDIGEDALIDRIYLPGKDLRRFGVSEKQIFAREFGENIGELVKFQIERARFYYQQAERGIALLERDTRFTVLLALRLYAKILDEIEQQNYNVFAGRAHTTFQKKFFSIPKVWLEARSL